MLKMGILHQNVKKPHLICIMHCACTRPFW